MGKFIENQRKLSKIVLAFDSFKGSLTSIKAAEAAAKAIHAVLPDCKIATVQIADGGEGTVDAICASSGLKSTRIECNAHNPLMRAISTYYEILSDGTAIIETASASGITLLSPDERNPMLTTTFGTGEQILDALNRGCRKFLIGLGGSATNDAAMGILAALGYRFADASGHELAPTGENLAKAEKIVTINADYRLSDCSFTLACDVESPFCGSLGAARIFAPQKGATPAQVEMLDNGMSHFAQLLKATFHTDIAASAGAGAAGGIGGTLCAALGARLCRGIDIVLEYADFDSAIADADLIITGEGSIDEQSGMGKAISGILSRANRQQVPVVALAGCVSGASRLNELGLKAVFSIQQRPISLNDAMNTVTAAKGIYSVTTQILKLLI